MGYLSAVDMGQHTDLQTAVSWHLQANLYPPVPQLMVNTAVQAINSVVLGLPDTVLDMPEGVSYRGQDQASAWTVVESLHLEAFVEVILSETWEG